ncbi:hypothetical protein QT196_02385 [Streptomyces sp. P9-2B-2]|uniref:hypothetical protein n=1 Tax=Streptomyces TaxID=1883 RepID=UPI00225ADEEE|nr:MULTISPECIES: hypothetical protein [Streptomyces]MCX4637659.1 hypothetical protein [Streptomyces platensis]WJY36202.1 hypothetical protein QT196_02385 [Streptomyces sp. P9-2B-2]
MTDLTSRWKARARLALAGQSVDSATADMVLDEVDLHCAQSGETPEDAFGAPEKYAAAVARDRIPPEERTGRNWDGLTRADQVSAALAQTGVAVLAAGVCMWVGDGTMLTVTPAGVAGSALLGVAIPSACLTATLASSRARGAVRWGVGAVAALLLSAGAFTYLPTASYGRLPVPALCALGVLLLWSAARYKPGPDHKELTSESQLLPENWLVELPRLLEERHGLSRARAAELTREAAHHLTATGCSPQEEFGPVELYALQVAEGQSVPRTRWWMRPDAQAAALAVLLVGYLVTNLASAGPAWQTVLAAVALATELALLTVSLLRKRPAVSTAR